jgi:transketolase
MVDRPGVVFLRTTREKTQVIYPPGEAFPIGRARVVRSSPDDQVTLIGAGITLHQALAAADELARQDIAARVIDLYSVKPVDVEVLREAAAATGRFVTVEDHWAEGGLGDAVLEVFANAEERPRILKLAVRLMPGSATPTEQLAAAGIDAAAIAEAARSLVAATSPVPADVAH